MNSKSDFESFYMEINEDLRAAALALIGQVEGGTLSLPAEIGGFKGFFLAASDDETVAALGAIVSERTKKSYKIGTVKVS